MFLVAGISLGLCVAGNAQSQSNDSDAAARAAQGVAGGKSAGKKTPPAGTDPASGKKGEQGGSSRSAIGTPLRVPSTAPAPPPPRALGRPSIGLALGGGGALAMSEVGVLQWFEEHHIPIDMMAGSSMGAMISALYATGKTPEELKVVMNDEVFNSVFSVSTSYKSKSYRRREDTRALPNAITIGLKHGVSFRNGVLSDQGLNAFLDRQFLRYDDTADFNTMPIPFRCIATDLNDASVVTFVRGSIPDAVRASISLPGIYRPFELNGHEYVDGGVLENLPTQTVRAMQADVVLAVSLPLPPVGMGSLNSILGVLQRSFSVAIEANERESRRLAAVVIAPDLTGYGETDYLKTTELAQRGYEAAERNKPVLLAYAVDDAAWRQYLAHRTSLRRSPAGNVLRVRVKAPNQSVTRAVERIFAPMVDKPADTAAIEARLDEIRSDGRFDADYTVGYEAQTAGPAGTLAAPASEAKPDASPAVAASVSDRPTILVTVADKKTGPPFLIAGFNVQAQTGGEARATIEGTVLDQDLGGYGSELRSRLKLGFETEFSTEYYRKIPHLGVPTAGVFLAPHGGLHRKPYFIFDSQRRLAERQLQETGAGLDLGFSNQRTQELRLGWEIDNIRWQTEVGSDGRPELFGSVQRARLRYTFDNQDRALVPQYGGHITVEAGYLHNAVASPETPRFTMQGSASRQIGNYIGNFSGEAGSMLNRNVAEPFRFTLGGPFHLSASAIDEYRGTDYFLLSPAILRRIARLPSPLGQSLYVGAGFEGAQMHAPGRSTVTREDFYLGFIAETPLGVITLAPAIGDSGHRKLVFTLGKVF